jgi:hypothetical protein
LRIPRRMTYSSNPHPHSTLANTRNHVKYRPEPEIPDPPPNNYFGTSGLRQGYGEPSGAVGLAGHTGWKAGMAA